MPTPIPDVGLIRHNVKAAVTMMFDVIRENTLVINKKAGNLREIQTMKRRKYKSWQID